MRNRRTLLGLGQQLLDHLVSQLIRSVLIERAHTHRSVPRQSSRPSRFELESQLLVCPSDLVLVVDLLHFGREHLADVVQSLIAQPVNGQNLIALAAVKRIQRAQVAQVGAW